jgi:CBS domain-containing protein
MRRGRAEPVSPQSCAKEPALAAALLRGREATTVAPAERDPRPPVKRKTVAMEALMKVKDVMHFGAEWIGPDTPITRIAQLMKQHDVGSLPVGENDKLIGMVTDRDLVCRGLANGGDISKLTARQVMTQGIHYCKDSEEIGDAIKTMTAKKIRRLPVIDANKRMVGMLALGDLTHAADKRYSADVMAHVSAHH